MIKYGTTEAIELWSAEVDALISEIENLRLSRGNIIRNEQTIESAKRLLSAQSGRPTIIRRTNER